MASVVCDRSFKKNDRYSPLYSNNYAVDIRRLVAYLM